MQWAVGKMSPLFGFGFRLSVSVLSSILHSVIACESFGRGLVGGGVSQSGDMATKVVKVNGKVEVKLLRVTPGLDICQGPGNCWFVSQHVFKCFEWRW